MTTKREVEISELTAELNDLLDLMCQFDEDAPEYRDLMRQRKPLLARLRKLKNQ